MTSSQALDLELMLSGAFAPLAGFMCRADAEAAERRLQLADGTIWPTPVVLEVSDSLARALSPAEPVALLDAEGNTLAALHVEDIWQSGSGARMAWHLGGAVEGLLVPPHHDFLQWRLGPDKVREEIARRGWRTVVGLQTDRVLHRPVYEGTRSVLERLQGGLLLQTIAAPLASGEIGYVTQVRCHRALLQRYGAETAIQTLLPLAPRGDSSRDLLLGAIVAKNYGCTHLFVNPDGDLPGNVFALLAERARTIGVALVPVPRMVYRPDIDSFVAESEIPASTRTLSLSAVEVQRALSHGAELPDWSTFPEVAAELRRLHPPRDRRGFTVFFTGLSGSGKSTIATVLRLKLLERFDRRVTLLDGDLVRRHLSSELGFSKEHRDLNIRRIGFVAGEITKHGGVAICSPIAPYDSVRREVRQAVESLGGFVLVFVDTPLDVCEARDRKGLYARARAGDIVAFTGVSDPYERPLDADIVVKTTEVSADTAADRILEHLERDGYLPPGPDATGG